MSEPRAPIAALAAVLLSLAAGCGQTETIRHARTLFVALTEYRLAPQSVQVSRGPLTIFVHNYGRVTHNLVISRDGQPQASTRPIWPGQTAELTLTLTPGSYLMASTILSDQTLGQYGTLRVSA